MDKFILNLIDNIVTQYQISVLSRELKCCLSTKEANLEDLRFDLDSIHRRLRLHSHFTRKEDRVVTQPDEGNYLNITNSGWHPPSMITLNEHDLNNRAMFIATGNNNFTAGKRQALREHSNQWRTPS